jgi:hypothetical protein
MFVYLIELEVEIAASIDQAVDHKTMLKTIQGISYTEYGCKDYF